MIYHYDEQGQLIEETEADGTPIRQYVWLGSTPVAQIEHSSSAITYLHTDHLTTPRAGTDAAGQLVWLWESDAFGEETPQNDPDGDGSETVVSLRFPGQYYDRETGLHYNYFRDYDPSTGRYIQSDPIGLAGGLNTYAYVGGNPLTRIDPTGEAFFAIPFFAGVGGGSTTGLGTAVLGGLGLAAIMSTPGDTPVDQPGDRQSEYQRMKDRCDKKPQKTGDRCADLSREIDHYENCANWYQHWDDKWNPRRHAVKIQNFKNRAAKLKRQYDLECTGKICP